jgi:predicted DNA-binding transcriptional regulator AlpA
MHDTRGAKMRVLIYPELQPKKGIPYTREHIRRREKAGTFPQHLDLGDARIGWIEEEIDEWIAKRAAQRSNPQTA